MLRTARAARLLSRIRPAAPGRAASQTVAGQRSLASLVPPQPKEPTELDKITTLPNGVRVASEDLPDAFSGVGVYIDAGSRYENDYLRGTSHIMDRLAFKSTATRSADAMLEAVEQLGGNIQCASSRESMMYQAATFNAAIPAALELLADTIRRPRLADDEIRQQLDTAAYEVGEIWSKPELILPELVHMAAFKDNTLGHPLLCPKERLSAIDRDVLRAYRDVFYRPERIVVAFAGVPHAEAVELTERHFGDMARGELPAPAAALSRTGSETSVDTLASSGLASAAASETSSSSASAPGGASPASSPPQQPSSSSSSSSSSSNKLLSKIPFFKNLSTAAAAGADAASVPASAPTPHPTPGDGPGRSRPVLTLDDLHRPARYTGGFLSLPPQPPPLNPHLPTFTHVHLAFEGLPISSDDIYALATLQTLLGGGGSFSAGGPGKGMYSRLYTNVLNQHGWVESCVAFNHSYTDSGLFGIAASCLPGRTAPMLDVMCRELRALTLDAGFAALGEAEVARAKNQLRSSLLMNLESRMVELEDLGRQVQVHGRKIPVRDMTARIEALTVADLRRVAREVLGGLVRNPGGGSGAPTVVLQEAQTHGGVAARPLGWDEIQDMIYRWQLGRR